MPEVCPGGGVLMFRIDRRITHRAFYNLELGDINSLVVKNASSYSLRKSLNVVVSRPRTDEVVVHLNTELQLPGTLYLTLSNSLKTLTLLKEG